MAVVRDGREDGASTSQRHRAALVTALRRPRYEVLPLAGVLDAVGEWVPKQVTVTVTASPRRGLEATLALTEQLSGQGLRAVPHLAARHIVDDSHLAEILRRLADARVREVFVVAGDIDEPAGHYADSLDLLSAMKRLDHGFEQVGIAGYPDGHPFIPDATLARSMAAKAPLATYVVSQLCFDPATVSAWIGRVRDDGVWLPVHLGIAGVVDRRRLLRVAARIGVGQSARFLRKSRWPVAHLVRPGGYRPDRLVRELAADLASPRQRVSGLHIYTLNDLRAIERWRRQALARLDAGP